MIDITKAILAIRKAQDGGHAEVIVNADDINQLTWYDGNPTNITNQQITDKQAELQAEFDALAYARAREEAYPTWQDQLDDIYHNGIDGWKATVKVTKDKYPKS